MFFFFVCVVFLLFYGIWVCVCMFIIGEGWWFVFVEKLKGFYLRGVCMSVNFFNVELFG